MAQLWALANNRDTSSVCETGFTDSDSGPRSCAESVAFVPFLILKFLMVSEQEKVQFCSCLCKLGSRWREQALPTVYFPHSILVASTGGVSQVQKGRVLH